MTNLSRWAQLPLRVMIAIGFLYHGIPKFSAEGHEMFLGMLQGIGVPAASLMSWIVPVVEVGGGVAVLLGVLNTLACLGLMAVQLVALFTVHLPNGFGFINITGQTPQGPTFGMPGIEVNLLYISILLAVLLGGPGVVRVGRQAARLP